MIWNNTSSLLPLLLLCLRLSDLENLTRPLNTQRQRLDCELASRLRTTQKPLLQCTEISS